MGYSEPDYTYIKDDDGNTADLKTYHSEYGDYSHTSGTVYSNGHSVYVDTYIDEKYGGSKTTTYDHDSGTTTSSSSGYSGK